MRWAVLTPYTDERAERRAHRQCVKELKKRTGVPHHAVRDCAIVDQARCALAELGLRTSAEIFLWIDGDIVFDVDAAVPFVERAFESNSSIVGGLYAHKRHGSQQIASELAPEVSEMLAYTAGYYPCTGVGFGWAAVKREAFERLGLHFVKSPFFADPIRPFFLPLIHGGRYLQEDFAFTRRVLEQGMRVSLDAEPRLLHEGSFYYALEDAIRPPTSARNVLIRIPR